MTLASKSVIVRFKRFWELWSSSPKMRQNTFYLVLGVVGWILIVLAYPFDWALPEYATY